VVFPDFAILGASALTAARLARTPKPCVDAADDLRGGRQRPAATPIGLADARFVLALIERLPQGAEKVRRFARRR
jgi:hypothetical protein